MAKKLTPADLPIGTRVIVARRGNIIGTVDSPTSHDNTPEGGGRETVSLTFGKGRYAINYIEDCVLAPATNITEAIATAKPLKGTRYALGSYTPTVGLSPRPRTIYVLLLNGVEVDRGSKADLTQCAKSAAGSPLGVCHARYDRIAEGK